MDIMLGWTIELKQNFAGKLKLEKGPIEHPDLNSCFLNKYSVYLATFGVCP